MNAIDMKRIERNVWHDYFQDGLAEILIGGYFLLTGLSLFAGVGAPFVALIVFYLPLLTALKKRVTYPRTGYVKLREGDPGPLPWFALGSAVLGLVALVATLIADGVIGQPGQWYRWMPVFFGIWLGGTLLGLALRVRLLRYYVAAAVALAGGLGFPFLTLAAKLGHIGLLTSAVGGVLLLWGLAAFLRFLRRYPRLAGEDSDGQR